MLIERKWAMPDPSTYSILPIKQLLEDEIKGEEWADPFARNTNYAKYTNDINPNTKAQHHLEALDFLKTFDTNSLDGVLFDPPYSPRQIKEVYDEIGIPLHDTKSSVWSNWKKEIARVVKTGGKVISFGWNTCGIGLTLDFKINRILLVCHGGNHNDTIITVETKGDKINYPSAKQTKLFEVDEYEN